MSRSMPESWTPTKVHALTQIYIAPLQHTNTQQHREGVLGAVFSSEFTPIAQFSKVYSS